MSEPPSEHVLSAFDVAGPVVRLAGGQGETFGAGHLVLKPGGEDGETQWVSDLVEALVVPGVRIPGPVRARDGSWLVDGWTATTWVPGDTDPDGHWPELLAACDRLHLALAQVPRPAFIDARQHRWARADRMAWGEEAVPDDILEDLVVASLVSRIRPVEPADQIVHQDLCGNVLFAASMPPAVIDWSLYWRPASYARALIVVDGMIWHDAQDDLGRAEADRADGAQLLLRALIFRLVVARLAEHEGREVEPWSVRCLEVVDLVAELAGR